MAEKTSRKSALYTNADTGAKILDVSPWKFNAVIASGRVTVRELPGLKPEYLISDLERIAKESIRHAIAS